VPTLTWILGAVGVAGGVVGTYFQVSGMSKTSDLDTCTPHCPANQIDTAKTTLWTGNVVLSVAAVALVSAVVVYLVRPTVYESK
jgi:hypothetical protein